MIFHLHAPITHITPASVITKDEYAAFFSKIDHSSKANPLPATASERICGMFAGYGGNKTGSDLQSMSVSDVRSFFSVAAEIAPKAASAIQLRHYDADKSLLVSNFVDFPSEGKQEPLAFKSFRASVGSVIPGDSGSGLFFQVGSQWKLVAIASMTSASDQLITQLLPGVHMLFSYWVPIRLSPDRFEKAHEVLTRKKAILGRA